MSQSMSPNPEEWSAPQKEAWKALEDHWECLVQAKIDDFIEFIHPEFRGFGHESPLMIDKPWLAKWVGFWAQSTKIPIYHLRPICITCFGNIAIVQYYIFTIEKSEVTGSKQTVRRYTMTWQKEDGKWQVIASHNNLMSDTVGVVKK